MMSPSKSNTGADLVLDDDFGFYSTPCPKCGKVNWGPGKTTYRVGGYTTRYVCNTQSFGGKWCNATANVKISDPDIVWVSANGKWHISDPAVSSPSDEFYRRVVQASDDGDSYCTIQMYSDGSIRSDWNLPKYVMDAARSILEEKRRKSVSLKSPKSKGSKPKKNRRS